jgi:hypothetical protein
MASEWVGVAGTAIGAGIGGVVTVASLIVKGRQDETAEIRRHEREDQQRADDRSWSLRQQQRDDRRALYAELVRIARELIRITREFPEDRIAEVGQLIDQFEETEATVSLMAVDDSVITASYDVFEAASDVRATRRHHAEVASGSGWMDNSRWAETAQALWDATENLIAACRRDLGFEPGSSGYVPYPIG